MPKFPHISLLLDIHLLFLLLIYFDQSNGKHMKIEQGTNNSFDNVRENFRSPIFIPWIQLQLGQGDHTMHVNFRMSSLVFYWKKLITFIKPFFYWQRKAKHSSSQLIY